MRCLRRRPAPQRPSSTATVLIERLDEAEEASRLASVKMTSALQDVKAVLNEIAVLSEAGGTPG